MSDLDRMEDTMLTKAGALVASVVLSLSIAESVGSVTVEPVQKLRPEMPNGIGSGECALGKDVAVIGIPDDVTNGLHAGAGYVFIREKGVWTESAKLLASDGDAEDYLSYRGMAVNGDTIVLGAPFDENDRASSGSAYVFVRSDNGWTEQARLLPQDDDRVDYFAWKGVSVDGDTVLIGGQAYYFRPTVYVFTRSGEAWTQTDILTLEDHHNHFDGFTGVIAQSGDTAVLGASSGGMGAAYVLRRSGDAWTREAKLVAGDTDRGDEFGGVIAVDGETVLIGARGHNGGKGAAYVFVRSSGRWIQQAELLADEDDPGRIFGAAVALSGDLALVSAPDAHRVYVFARWNGVWTRQTKFAPEGESLINFPSSTSLKGRTALIGVPGAAYVFRLVIDPSDFLDDLASRVRALSLPRGLENSLIMKLEASKLLSAGAGAGGESGGAASHVLRAFVQEIEAQRGRKIAEADAEGLVSGAHAIVALAWSEE
jgi:FG-GAP repeat